MSEEHSDPRDERIAELEAQVKDLETANLIMEGQVDAARPALVRDAISQAGYDPNSQQGRILQELAKNADFRADSDWISLRAESLGFEPDEQTPVVSQRQPDAAVPPGKARELARLEKTRGLADALVAGISIPAE